MKISVSTRSASDSKFKMRKMGLIPGIIFSKTQNDLISMSEKEYKKMRMSHDPLMETEEGTLVILKEVQKDPISNKPIHLTFQAINKDQSFTAEVKIHLDSGAVNFSSQGMSLKMLKTSLKVKATAQSMVDHITVDVSKLPVNHVLHLKDITLPKGIESLEDENCQICVINYLKIEEEPEVVKPSAISPASVPLVTKDKPAKDGDEKAPTTPPVEAPKTNIKAPTKA